MNPAGEIPNGFGGPSQFGKPPDLLALRQNSAQRGIARDPVLDAKQHSVMSIDRPCQRLANVTNRVVSIRRLNQRLDVMWRIGHLLIVAIAENRDRLTTGVEFVGQDSAKSPVRARWRRASPGSPGSGDLDAHGTASASENRAIY